MNILGIDIGFAKLGWAVVRLEKDAEHVLDAGLIKTRKDKRTVLQTYDNARRVREISRDLRDVFDRNEITAISAESMSWPRSSSNCAKIGMGWGVLLSLAEGRDIPVVFVSPQDLKEKLTGKRSASKQEVQDALFALPGFNLEGHFKAMKLARGQWEHPVDAAAAVVATLQTDMIRAMVGARRQK